MQQTDQTHHHYHVYREYVGGGVLFDPPCVTKKNMILELSGLTTVLVYFFPGKKKVLYDYI